METAKEQLWKTMQWMLDRGITREDIKSALVDVLREITEIET